MKNAPTETGPLPQSLAQDLFVIRVRGHPSLRRVVPAERHERGNGREQGGVEHQSLCGEQFGWMVWTQIYVGQAMPERRVQLIRHRVSIGRRQRRAVHCKPLRRLLPREARRKEGAEGKPQAVKRFVWLLDRFHSIYFIGRKTSKRIYVVRGETDKKAAYIYGQIICGQNSGRKCERMPSWRRSKSGHMKSSILITHENCEGSISLTRRTRNSRRPSRTRVRSWKHQWLLLCLVKLWKIVGVVASNKI